MGERLPPVKTPLTRDAIVNATLIAWPDPATPTRAAVELVASQIDLETGLKSCYCFNLGNIKGNPTDPTRCHTSYPCGEELRADLYQKNCPKAGSRIVRTYDRNGVPYVSVKLDASHPWSVFRAYRSLSEAMVDHLAFIFARPAVWATLATGDAAKFAAALKKAGYYTADEKRYARILVERRALLRRPGQVRDITWGDVI